ncbi:hypothetical protein [Luteolibacter luteus]|uniref:HMA domain-containing protein n=1 Tax=Luteolibacter luteus TaxID=2728835 RepID=A0A858RJF3_9BACT|nr:hypothetical protein [Luteolibacter luteus]QJE96845.1 hypothetical protein HHL09_13975 [Luteolibacter luteus]
MESRSEGKPPRLIVRYRGKGAAPLEQAQEEIAKRGLQVVDRSSRMLLLEDSGTVSSAESLKRALPEWSVSEEIHYSIPDPTPRVKGPGKS